jgi:hypothetical protein
MKPHRYLAFVVTSVAMLAGLGCTNNHQYGLQPPPPPAYAAVPPLVQVADRDGFRTGESDGAIDAREGRHYRAQSTRAYHDTPGYDRNLGPFPPYRDAFRNAYLRGYDRGFRHG